MARYLLDSVIVIDHFNGVEAATEFLAAHGRDCVISVITRAETLAGFPAASESLALLDTFATLPVTVEVADAAARLRRTQRWKLPDAIQAAIAIQEGLTLVTRNTRDFKAGGPPRQSAAPRPAHLEPAPVLPDERGLAGRQRIVNRPLLSLLLTCSRRQAIMLRLFSTRGQKPILCFRCPIFPQLPEYSNNYL